MHRRRHLPGPFRIPQQAAHRACQVSRAVNFKQDACGAHIGDDFKKVESMGAGDDGAVELARLDRVLPAMGNQ